MLYKSLKEPLERRGVLLPRQQRARSGAGGANAAQASSDQPTGGGWFGTGVESGPERMQSQVPKVVGQQ